MGDKLAAAAQRWQQREDEPDGAYERRLYNGARSAALELLCVSKALGWGSGDPHTDAAMHLMQMAERHMEFFRYKQPAPRARAPRKKLGNGLVRAVWDRDGWECQECGSHRDLTVDHITPVVLDGDETDMANLQTLCKPCNSRKGARV